MGHAWLLKRLLLSLSLSLFSVSLSLFLLQALHLHLHLWAVWLEAGIEYEVERCITIPKLVPDSDRQWGGRCYRDLYVYVCVPESSDSQIERQRWLAASRMPGWGQQHIIKANAFPAPASFCTKQLRTGLINRARR